MTNKFKIGDIVRELESVQATDADGNYIYRRSPAGGEISVWTKAWSKHTLKVVAVPDGKRKRYGLIRIEPNETRIWHKAEATLATA
jgi:hypothetical protein